MQNEIIQQVNSNIDSKSIYELLEKQPTDTTITYQEIEAICLNKNPEKVRSSTNRAIKDLLNNGIVYHNVRLIGYKRATSSEIVHKAPSYIQSAKRRLSKNHKSLEIAKDDELSRDEVAKKNTYYAVTGVLMYLIKPKQIKSIEQKAINHTLSFNPEDSLKHLAHS